LATPRRTVTALRSRSRDRVLVELDGEPWRVLPATVVVRTGLSEGLELDRCRLRTLRRELRRSDAFAVAARALRARALSVRRVAERLEQPGIPLEAREDTLRALVECGVVDDRRLASAWAHALCERGLGDGAIRFRLDLLGLEDEEIRAALAELAPEDERAREIAAQQGQTQKTARYLARRGFGADAIETAVGSVLAENRDAG
jgi:SOS response regulatory protein OraA/RecX